MAHRQAVCRLQTAERIQELRRIGNFTGSHFKMNSHFQDSFQLLQFGLLFLYLAVIVLSQICQQLPCNVQHLLQDGSEEQNVKRTACRLQVTKQTPVTVTCSCFGFFSFNLPVLYPPYFSNRSKNLNEEDEYNCKLHGAGRHFLLKGTNLMLCRFNPKGDRDTEGTHMGLRTSIFIFCLGVRSPWRMTAMTQRSSILEQRHSRFSKF